MDMSTAADWHKAFIQKNATSAQYRRLCGIAGMVFGAGHDAILDTSYVKFAERNQAHELAAR